MTRKKGERRQRGERRHLFGARVHALQPEDSERQVRARATRRYRAADRRLYRAGQQARHRRADRDQEVGQAPPQEGPCNRRQDRQAGQARENRQAESVRGREMSAADEPSARRTPPDPIPLTVLTGFLGAGKTTLLNRLLKDPALAET